MNLKTRDSSILVDSASFNSFSEDYLNILEVSEHLDPIKFISEKEAFKFLHAMKLSVTDFIIITINHYAGPVGWRHFRVLLNCLIYDVNKTVIKEVNTVHAIIIMDVESSRPLTEVIVQNPPVQWWRRPWICTLES